MTINNPQLAFLLKILDGPFCTEFKNTPLPGSGGREAPLNRFFTRQLRVSTRDLSTVSNEDCGLGQLESVFGQGETTHS